MKIIINSALVALLIMLTGCVAPYKVSLKDNFNSAEHKIHVSTYLPQKEIAGAAFYANRGNAAIAANTTTPAIGAANIVGSAIGLGIISAIESSRLEKQNIELEPLRKVLNNHDFSSFYHQSMKDMLDNSQLSANGHHFKEYDFDHLSIADGEYLIEFNSQYNLNRQFNALEFGTYVTLSKVKFNKVRSSKQKIKNNKIVKVVETKMVIERDVIFKNRYQYVSKSQPLLVKTSEDIALEKRQVEAWYQKEKEKAHDMTYQYSTKKELEKLEDKRSIKLAEAEEPFTTHERNIAMSKYWAKDNAETLKNYLNEAVSEISTMFLLDFSDTLPANQYSKNKTLERYKRKFQIVKKTEERMIIRSLFGNEIGKLISLPVEAD